MNILTIHVSQLVPGMIVAEDVYTPRKERILSRNTIISPKSILKLKLNAIKDITVCVPKNLTQQFPSEDIGKSNELKASVEFKKFKKYYTACTDQLKANFNGILGYSNEPLVPSLLLNSVNDLLKESRNSLRTFDMLQAMRDYDDIVYVHSLNVALICSSFASWLNFSPEDMQQLLLAALLHDIGKLKIPLEIIRKPSSLTEEEYTIIKQHPVLGYELIKQLPLDSRVKDAVLMHHERCDGSGYPGKRSNNEIAPFASIIAIADVYDAMTANRSYRNGICPFEVISNFEKEGYQKYDAKYLLPFLESLALAYMNATVRLNNSLIGEIVMINKQSLSRPIVKVENQFFDLSKEKNLEIIRVL